MINYLKIKQSKKPIVLYFPTLNFSFLKQRPQQIMSQFAKNGYTVLFCNNTRTDHPMEEVEPNLFVIHNFEELLLGIKYKKIKIDIAYATWAKSHEYFDDVKAKLYIYDSLDNFKDWHDYEPFALNKANIILTSSQELYQMRCKTNNEVYLIKNAAPSEYINKEATMPEEFKNVDHPIVTFLGAHGQWVKTSLLRKVADKYKTFFVGMEFGNKLPSNIINLGVKNHDDLYNYYYYSDVCLIPFNLSNPVTISANPVKMWEQMASGCLTVATQWSETVGYSDVVYTGETDEQFLEMVDKAVSVCQEQRNEIREKAKFIATQNTWEKRFEQIQGILDSHCKLNGVSF